MAIPNVVFLDIETRKVSGDFPDGWGPDTKHWETGADLGSRNILKMQFGVAATFDNTAFRFWLDPVELFCYLQSEAVDAIVTFNGERFDFLVLLAGLDPEPYDDATAAYSEAFREGYAILKQKSIDVLREVEAILGHRVSLDQITSVLFDHSKDFDGSKWWGMFCAPDITGRVRAINYLLADVLQLYKVYGVAHECGQLAFRNQLGQTQAFDIKIPTPLDLKK